jgi:hypothetical protein
MSKDTLRQLAVVVSVIATIAVNALANALPLNGQTTGEISDRFPVYFVPAGYVFAIWGLIYIGMIAFAVYQALPGQRDNPRLRRAGYLFALSGVANIAWLFLWHYEQFPWTLLAMGALLVLLILTYLGLEIGRTRVPAGETWLVRVPISVYLGWITVATIANVTSVLYFLGWNGGSLGPETWTVIMLAVTVAVSAAMSLTRGDVAYLLVIIWAVTGIAVKHAGTPAVATAAWVAAGAVLLLVVVAIIVQGRRRRAGLQPA